MRAYLYVVGTGLLFSLVGIMVKLIGDAVPAMTLNFYRVFFGFLLLLLVVPFIDKNVFRVSKKELLEYFIIGLVTAVSLSLYTTANRFTPVQNAVLIHFTYPFFVAIFAYFLLRETISKRTFFTICAAFFGLLIINPLQPEHVLGNMMSFTAAIIFGFLVVLMRKADKHHGIGDVFWFMLFASLLLVPFPIVEGWGSLTDTWPYVLTLGILSTGVAYLLYNLALEEIEANVSSVIIMIVTPLSSIVLASLFVQEQLITRTLIGGAVVLLAGVYYGIRKSHHRPIVHT